MAKIDDAIDKEKQALWTRQKEAIDIARKRLALMDLEFTEVKWPDEANQTYLNDQAKLILDTITQNFKV